MPPETETTANPAGLLPALHRLQADHGHISDADVERLARQHNLSRAEVEGVIGFYHDFRRVPGGRHRLLVCRAESCQAMGGEALANQARHSLGVEFGATSADGAVTLESTYCLGNCACSPALMFDGRLYGRVSPEVLDALLAGRVGK